MTESSHVRAAVLAASASRNAGGLFWAVRSLCSSVIDKGVDVQVFAGEDAHTDADQHTWGQVPVTVLPSAGPRAFGYQRGLEQALRTYHPDLLHVQGLWMYPSMAALQWSNGKRPYLISPHGMLDPWAVRNSAWKKRIAGLLYENAHLRGAVCIHALCEAERDAIRAYGLKNPVAVIPNGVDLPTLSEVLSPPVWNSCLPSSTKVLLFLSRLHPKKGLVGLLDAWAQSRLRGVHGAEEWQLVVAGWEQGAHRLVLERKARELNIESSVHFVGPQFDQAKAASLARADAFVLPSLSEGLPMSVLEAWSYELPVLMTPQCNLPQGFAENAAIRVEPEIGSLVEGLASLFSLSDRERQTIGQCGRELVERNFAWPSIGAEMVDVYRWTLGGGPRPDQVSPD